MWSHTQQPQRVSSYSYFPAQTPAQIYQQPPPNYHMPATQTRYHSSLEHYGSQIAPFRPRIPPPLPPPLLEPTYFQQQQPQNDRLSYYGPQKPAPIYEQQQKGFYAPQNQTTFAPRTPPPASNYYGPPQQTLQAPRQHQPSVYPISQQYDSSLQSNSGQLGQARRKKKRRKPTPMYRPTNYYSDPSAVTQEHTSPAAPSTIKPPPCDPRLNQRDPQTKPALPLLQTKPSCLPEEIVPPPAAVPFQRPSDPRQRPPATKPHAKTTTQPTSSSLPCSEPRKRDIRQVSHAITVMRDEDQLQTTRIIYYNFPSNWTLSPRRSNYKLAEWLETQGWLELYISMIHEEREKGIAPLFAQTIVNAWKASFYNVATDSLSVFPLAPKEYMVVLTSICNVLDDLMDAYKATLHNGRLREKDPDSAGSVETLSNVAGVKAAKKSGADYWIPFAKLWLLESKATSGHESTCTDFLSSMAIIPTLFNAKCLGVYRKQCEKDAGKFSCGQALSMKSHFPAIAHLLVPWIRESKLSILTYSLIRAQALSIKARLEAAYVCAGKQSPFQEFDASDCWIESVVDRHDLIPYLLVDNDGLVDAFMQDPESKKSDPPDQSIQKSLMMISPCDLQQQQVPQQEVVVSCQKDTSNDRLFSREHQNEATVGMEASIEEGEITKPLPPAKRVRTCTVDQKAAHVIEYSTAHKNADANRKMKRKKKPRHRHKKQESNSQLEPVAEVQQPTVILAGKEGDQPKAVHDTAEADDGPSTEGSNNRCNKQGEPKAQTLLEIIVGATLTMLPQTRHSCVEKEDTEQTAVQHEQSICLTMHGSEAAGLTGTKQIDAAEAAEQKSNAATLEIAEARRRRRAEKRKRNKKTKAQRRDKLRSAELRLKQQQPESDVVMKGNSKKKARHRAKLRSADLQRKQPESNVVGSIMFVSSDDCQLELSEQPISANTGTATLSEQDNEVLMVGDSQRPIKRHKCSSASDTLAISLDDACTGCDLDTASSSNQNITHLLDVNYDVSAGSITAFNTDTEPSDAAPATADSIMAAELIHTQTFGVACLLPEIARTSSKLVQSDPTTIETDPAFLNQEPSGRHTRSSTRAAEENSNLIETRKFGKRQDEIAIVQACETVDSCNPEPCRPRTRSASRAEVEEEADDEGPNIVITDLHERECGMVMIGRHFQCVIPQRRANSTGTRRKKPSDCLTIWDPIKADAAEASGEPVTEFMSSKETLGLQTLKMEALHLSNYCVQAAKRKLLSLIKASSGLDIDLNSKEAAKFLRLLRGIADIESVKCFFEIAQTMKRPLQTILIHYYRWKVANRAAYKKIKKTCREGNARRLERWERLEMEASLA